MTWHPHLLTKDQLCLVPSPLGDLSIASHLTIERTSTLSPLLRSPPLHLPVTVQQVEVRAISADSTPAHLAPRSAILDPSNSRKPPISHPRPLRPVGVRAISADSTPGPSTLRPPFLSRPVTVRAIAEVTTSSHTLQVRAPSPLLSSPSSPFSLSLSSPPSSPSELSETSSDTPTQASASSGQTSRQQTPPPSVLLGRDRNIPTPPGFWDDIFASLLDDDLTRPNEDSDNESYHTPLSRPSTPIDLPAEPETITVLPPSSLNDAGSTVYVRHPRPGNTHRRVRVRIYSDLPSPLPTLPPFVASSIRVFTDPDTGVITDIHIRRNDPSLA